MGGLMNDALGVGLAAPQIGLSQRLLVYRVGHDAPLIALVNPEIEWTSDEEEEAEEGCLSIPGVAVDVERPVHVRVRAQDEAGDRARGRGLWPRGPRDPARGGSPQRRPDPRPHDARSSARKRCALSARPRTRPKPPERQRTRLRAVRTVYLGTSEFAVRCWGGSLARAHRPQLVVTRPDRPRGRGRQAAAAAGGGGGARAWGSSCTSRGRELGGGARADRRLPARRASVSAPSAR